MYIINHDRSCVGFLCPVHTPDGAPCGLLNHLSHTCKAVTQSPDVSGLPQLLISLGLAPMLPGYDCSMAASDDQEMLCVQLDGKILGWCTAKFCRRLAALLREWRAHGDKGVAPNLEVGYVPRSNGGQFPGLYLFSSVARMTRPVHSLAVDKIDWVGPFEQVRSKKVVFCICKNKLKTKTPLSRCIWILLVSRMKSYQE